MRRGWPSNASNAPRSATSRGDRRAAFGPLVTLLCSAQFLVNLDFSIVHIALPTIQRGLRFAPEHLQWVVTAYALAFGGCLLLGGRAADVLGRRRVFVTGMALFGTASVVGGLAPSPAVLIGARAAQGLGAALVSPAALALINVSFREGPERSRALSAFGILASLGFVSGVLVGGFVTELANWRWVLLINAPICLVTCIAAGRLIRAQGGPAEEECGAGDVERRDSKRRFDVTGAVLATGAMVTLIVACTEAGGAGWASAQTLGLLGLGAALAIAFVAVERRTPVPLVPLEIFKDRPVAVGNTVAALMTATGVSFLFVLTLYLQEVLKLTPVQTGLVFLPVGLSALVTGLFVERILTFVSVRTLLVAGMATFCAGMLILTWIQPSSGVGVVIAGSVIGAAGNVLSVVSFTLLATSGVRPALQGVASGVINASQQVGAALGVAVIVAVSAARTNAAGGTGAVALVSGYRAGLLTGAAFLAVGAGMALLAGGGSASGGTDTACGS